MGRSKACNSLDQSLRSEGMTEIEGLMDDTARMCVDNESRLMSLFTDSIWFAPDATLMVRLSTRSQVQTVQCQPSAGWLRMDGPDNDTIQVISCHE